MGNEEAVQYTYKGGNKEAARPFKWRFAGGQIVAEND